MFDLIATSGIIKLRTEALFECAMLLVGAVVALVLAWWRRSITVVVSVCVILLLAGLFWGFWLVFIPSTDPAEADLDAWWRLAVAAWALVLVAGLGSVIALIQLRRL